MLAVVLIPGVGVSVEQHERHRTVHRVLGAQLAEHDRVVAAEHQRHDPGLEQRPQAGVDLLGRAQRVPGRDARSPPSTSDSVSNTSTPRTG